MHIDQPPSTRIATLYIHTMQSTLFPSSCRSASFGSGGQVWRMVFTLCSVAMDRGSVNVSERHWRISPCRFPRVLHACHWVENMTTKGVFTCSSLLWSFDALRWHEKSEQHEREIMASLDSKSANGLSQVSRAFSHTTTTITMISYRNDP